jgi:hypothetical protein
MPADALLTKAMSSATKKPSKQECADLILRSLKPLSPELRKALGCKSKTPNLRAKLKTASLGQREAVEASQ